MKKRNDEERRLWVINDEGLWREFQRSPHHSIHAYIRANRKWLDAVIERMESGEKPPHYLEYGP